jgi:hypothetical protein
MAAQLEGWVDHLASNLDHGNVAIFNPVHWDPAPGRQGRQASKPEN